MRNNEEIDTSEKNFDGVRSGDVSLSVCVCVQISFLKQQESVQVFT